MKTLLYIAITVLIATPAFAGLTPFAHTTTLGTGDILLTGDLSHDLDQSDADLVGLRVAYSPADYVDVIGEIYGPSTFEDAGFTASVMGYLDAGDMPFRIQLRAGVDIPPDDGNVGVLFDVALVETYHFRSPDGLTLYGAWGTVAFVETTEDSSWIEAHFAAGLRYLFQGQGVAVFMEFGELFDTYVTGGMSVYL